MSSFVCPHCGHEEGDLLDRASGAAHEAADAELGLPFLGAVLRSSPQVREGGDQGVLAVVIRAPRSRSAAAFIHIAERVAQAASIAALAQAPGQGSAAG